MCNSKCKPQWSSRLWLCLASRNFPGQCDYIWCREKKKRSQPVTITTNLTTTVIAIGAKSHNKTTMPTSSQSLELQSSLGFPHLSWSTQTLFCHNCSCSLVSRLYFTLNAFISREQNELCCSTRRQRASKKNLLIQMENKSAVSLIISRRPDSNTLRGQHAYKSQC